MSKQLDNIDGPLAPEEITADSPFTLPGFFNALSTGRLLGAVCTECDTNLIPPRPACYACGSRALRIEEMPTTGEVVTYTEITRPPSSFQHLAPITMAIVELDSGARLTGRVDAPWDAVSIGATVELSVREADIDEAAMLAYETEWPLHIFELA